MIRTLVESAFKTGCLSVESEGLIRQVVAFKGYGVEDAKALKTLCSALEAGGIEREGPVQMSFGFETNLIKY